MKDIPEPLYRIGDKVILHDHVYKTKHIGKEQEIFDIRNHKDYGLLYNTFEGWITPSDIKSHNLMKETTPPAPKYMPNETVVYSRPNNYGCMVIKNICYHDRWGDGKACAWNYTDGKEVCREHEILYKLESKCACSCKTKKVDYKKPVCIEGDPDCKICA